MIEKLVERQVLTQLECNTITRKGNRKKWYYGRHIRDLCNVALDKMQRYNQEDEYITNLCEQLLDKF